MKRSIKWAAGAAAALALGGVVFSATGPNADAGHGPMQGMGHGPMQGMAHGPMQGMGQGPMQGMRPGSMQGPMAGPTAMLTRQDAGSAADMGVVHDLLNDNTRIKRSVVNLPDGIRTITESDDPKVAQAIKAHVASMSQRLEDGREFNLFSKTLPVLFENRDKIRSKVEMTDKGAVVTRTSADARVVAALQGHAAEVSELARDGMAAMRRGMMSRMAMGGMGGMGGPMGRGANAGEDAHRH